MRWNRAEFRWEWGDTGKQTVRVDSCGSLRVIETFHDVSITFRDQI